MIRARRAGASPIVQQRRIAASLPQFRVVLKTPTLGTVVWGDAKANIASGNAPMFFNILNGSDNISQSGAIDDFDDVRGIEPSVVIPFDNGPYAYVNPEGIVGHGSYAEARFTGGSIEETAAGKLRMTTVGGSRRQLVSLVGKTGAFSGADRIGCTYKNVAQAAGAFSNVEIMLGDAVDLGELGLENGFSLAAHIYIFDGDTVANYTLYSKDGGGGFHFVTGTYPASDTAEVYFERAA